MRAPLFSSENGKVYVDTPWARETAFSTELLEQAEWVHVVRGVNGEPLRVIVAVTNGTADYEVTRFDDLTGVVEVRLKKCHRIPRPRRRKLKDPAGRVIGRHSTGCYSQLREAPDGGAYCEGCGWTSASEVTP